MAVIRNRISPGGLRPGLSGDKAWAFLEVYEADNQHIYPALTQHRAEIDAQLDGGAEWEQGESQSWVGLRTQAVLSDPMIDLEAVGGEIAENLLRLRAVAQPYLDDVMNKGAASPDDEHAG